MKIMDSDVSMTQSSENIYENLDLDKKDEKKKSLYLTKVNFPLILLKIRILPKFHMFFKFSSVRI